MVDFLGVAVPRLWIDALIFAGGAFVGWLGRFVLIEYRLRRERSLNETERKVKEIYRPLYREFQNIAENGIPRQGWKYRTRWEELDADLKRDTDEEIRSRIEEFVEKLHQLQDITKEIDKLNNRIGKHAKGITLTEEIEAQFPEHMIYEHDKVQFSFRDMDGERSGSMPLGSFLYEYGHILAKAENPEDLHQRLLNHPRDVFEYWDKDFPGWQYGIWELKSHPRLNEVWPLIREKSEKELVEKQEEFIEELESEAAEIRVLLNEKI